MRHAPTLFRTAAAMTAVLSCCMHAGRAHASRFLPSPSELQPAENIAGNQTYPCFDVTPSGRSMIGWSGGSAGRLYAGGEPATGELTVMPAPRSGRCSVAAGSSAFLIVNGGEGRIIDDQGVAYGDVFALDDLAGGAASRASAASIDGNRVVATWVRVDGTQSSIRARVIDLSAAEQAPAFTVSSIDAADVELSSLGVDGASGGRLVFWWNRLVLSRNGSYTSVIDDDVFVRMYQDIDTPLTDAFVVHDSTFRQQMDVRAAVLEDGGFLFAWWSYWTSPGALFSRRFDAMGVAATPPTLLCTDCFLPLAVARDGAIVGAERFVDSVARVLDADGRVEPDSYAFFDDLRLRYGRGQTAILTPGGSLMTGTYSISGVSPEATDGDGGRLAIRTFCAPTDAACDRCPGFEDDEDADADGIPDACDRCTNIEGERTAAVAKVYVSYVPDWGTVVIPWRDNRMEVRTSFDLPEGAALDDLDLPGLGMRVRLEGVSGTGAVADVTLPGGTFSGAGTRGWQAKATKVRYLDRTDDSVNGIRKVVVSGTPSRVTPGATTVSMLVVGRAGFYADNHAHLPLELVLMFEGGQTCAEAAFTRYDCWAGAWDGPLRCSY